MEPSWFSRLKDEAAGSIRSSKQELPPRVSSAQALAKSNSGLLSRLAEGSRAQLAERLQRVKEQEVMAEIWSAERCMLEVQNCTILLWEEMAKHGDQIDKQTMAALDTMKSEYSAALSEIRKDLGVHQSIQAELSEMRASLNMKLDTSKSPEPQHQLSETLAAVSALRSDVHDCRAEQQSKFATLHECLERQGGAISLSDSSIADLRNEMQLLRIQWQQDHVSQDEAHSSTVQDLRRQLNEMQRETSQALKEMEKRNFLDVTKKLEESQQRRDSVGTDAGYAVELSQSIDKLRSEVNLDRSHADLRISNKLQEVDLRMGNKLQDADGKILKCEAFITDLQKQFEDNTRHLDQMQQVGAALKQQRDDHSSRIDSLKRLIEEDQLKRSQEAAMLGARLDGVERSTSSAVSAASLNTPEMAQLSVRLDALETSHRNMALSASHQNHEGRDNLKSEALATILERLEILELKSMSAGSTGSYATNEIGALTARLHNLETTCRETIQAAVEQVKITLRGDSSSSFGARLLKLEQEFANAGKVHGGASDSEKLSEIDKSTGGSAQSATMNTIASDVLRLVADVSSRIGSIEQAVNDGRLMNLERVINLEGEVKKLSLVVAALMEHNSKVLSGGLATKTDDLITSSTTSTKDRASESSPSRDSIDGASHEGDYWFANLQRLLSQAGTGPGSLKVPSLDKTNLRISQSEPRLPKPPAGDPNGAATTRLHSPIREVRTSAATDEVLPSDLKESLHELVNAVQRTLVMPGESAAQGGSIKVKQGGVQRTLVMQGESAAQSGSVKVKQGGRSPSPPTRERRGNGEGLSANVEAFSANAEVLSADGSQSSGTAFNKGRSPEVSKAATPSSRPLVGSLNIALSDDGPPMSVDPPRVRDTSPQEPSRLASRPSSQPSHAAGQTSRLRTGGASVTTPVATSKLPPSMNSRPGSTVRAPMSSSPPITKQMPKSAMPELRRSLSPPQVASQSYQCARQQTGSQQMPSRGSTVSRGSLTPMFPSGSASPGPGSGVGNTVLRAMNVPSRSPGR